MPWHSAMKCTANYNQTYIHEAEALMVASDIQIQWFHDKNFMHNILYSIKLSCFVLKFLPTAAILLHCTKEALCWAKNNKFYSHITQR